MWDFFFFLGGWWFLFSFSDSPGDSNILLHSNFNKVAWTSLSGLTPQVIAINSSN